MKEELDKKLRQNKIEHVSIEERWDRIKTITKETAAEVLGIQGRRRKEDWYDEQCQEAINIRNNAYKKYLERRTRERHEEYKVKTRIADKTCRCKKRKYENNKLQKMEEDFKENNSKNAYTYIHQLREGFKPRKNLCRDKTGKIISDADSIKQVWKGYSEKLLENNTTAKNKHTRANRGRRTPRTTTKGRSEDSHKCTKKE